VIDSAADVIIETASSTGDLVESTIDIDLSQPGFSGIENLTLLGSAIIGIGNEANNIITGNTQNNILEGRGGNDVLLGDAGNDFLDAGTGNDTMNGGLGDDTYVVDSSGDVVSENNPLGGIDTVRSSAPTLTLGDNIENLILVPGAGDIEGIGNTLDNVITGNEGNNRLEGRAGNDTLIGGGGVDTMLGGVGDDIYFVDNAADEVIDNPGQGFDQVFTTVSYTLAGDSEIEVLTLQPGAGNINGIGNGFANLIVGNAGNNLLDGGEGDDVMRGGIGNDTYVISSAGDVVEELVGVGGGTDLIRSNISFDLNTPSGTNIENLTLLESPDALNATGNGLRNVIRGNSLNNFIDGGGGDDTLIGGDGDDTYLVNDSSDIITEFAGQGIDTVRSQSTLTLAANLEILILEPGFGNINGTGNQLNNTIIGNEGVNSLSGGEGDDFLDGGTGIDSFTGGLGNDTFVVDNSTETVVEAVGEGIDEVRSSVTYTLGANLEDLILTGTNAINGTGNNLSNVIEGNIANNVLDGRGGADTMRGGLGDDTYFVDNINDIIEELEDEGVDQVFSTISYTLSDFVENLTLTGITGNENLVGTGNNRRNTIIGNNGDNQLLGLGGNDVLVGSGGNDLLDGGTGDDVMEGGAGNDTYIVTSTGDILIEQLGEGTDLVIASESYILGANLENLTLTGATGNEDLNGTGNELNNIIIGNNGNNRLDGGLGGVDRLRGGLGDDTYVVTGEEDIIEELASAGFDTVETSGTYVLSANLENLILTGTANINGFGNGDGNEIEGNSGNNILDGKGGADTMIGGDGNDTYYVDNIGDFVLENGTGIDTVVSSIDYDLSGTTLATIENLSLSGSAFRGIGNAGNNVIIGNTINNLLEGRGGNDTITGGEGNDTLQGQLGNDTLTGGLGDDFMNGGVGDDILTGGVGSDRFLFDTGSNFVSADLGVDTITDFEEGIDKIVLDLTTFQAVEFRPSGSDPLVGVFGSNDFRVVATDGDVAASIGRIVYSTASSQLFYNPDGSGAGAGTAFAFLQGSPTLTASSFSTVG